MASIVIGDYTYNTNGSVSVVDKTKQSYGSILSSFEYDGQTYDVTDMSYCFYECVNLIDVPTIPEGITNMSSCFEDCVSLVETPTIPTSVEDLSYCFFRCTSLKHADDFRLTTTPVLKDMTACFAYCTSLTKAPKQIPRSVTTLESCFLDCKSLARSPQSIYSIVASGADPLNMKYCFNGCESLKTSPALPNKITNLEACFAGCINLTNVSRLPKNVVNVSSCFDRCRSLQGNIEVQNIPEYSANIFANLSNQNIYIINIASSEIKEDVAEEWRSIANQYRSVHYEADDHGVPTITLSAKRSNNDGESSSTGRYITVTKQYNYNLDNLPVDWDITLTESMKLDSVLITPASSEPGELITFTIPQEIDELSHTIVYTVNDGYKTTTQTVEISKVIALLDFFGNPPNKVYPNDKPGMGMAIGNIAKRNGLDIQFPTTIGEGLVPPQKNGGVALDNYQLIIGKYNDTDSQYEDDLFIIGNGTNDANRKNTFTIDQNGYMNVVNGFEIKVQNNALMTFKPGDISIGQLDGTQSYANIKYNSFQLFDIEAAELIYTATEFDGESTYQVGDIIKFVDFFTEEAEEYYRCKVAVTTPGPWDSTYWERIYPNPYFSISDLRDRNGKVDYSEKIIIDRQKDGTNVVTVSYPILTLGDIYINGVEEGAAQWTSYNNDITFPNRTLHEGDIVVIEYTIQYDAEGIELLKSYNLGYRNPSSSIGQLSLIDGFNNEASGKFSYAGGIDCEASGAYSYARGQEAKARGRAAHAEGYNAIASGTNSHAEGYHTTASGTNSHAEGWETIAIGYASHAQNEYTIANYEAQTVIGKYNDNKSNTLFEIGNGTSDSERSNSHEFTESGNIKIALYTTEPPNTTTIDGQIYQALKDLGWTDCIE